MSDSEIRGLKRELASAAKRRPEDVPLIVARLKELGVKDGLPVERAVASKRSKKAAE